MIMMDAVDCVIVNTPLQGLYVITHECIIPYSTCRGVLTGLYPHCCNSTTSVVSDYDQEGRCL